MWVFHSSKIIAEYATTCVYITVQWNHVVERWFLYRGMYKCMALEPELGGCNTQVDGGSPDSQALLDLHKDITSPT